MNDNIYFWRLLRYPCELSSVAIIQLHQHSEVKQPERRDHNNNADFYDWYQCDVTDWRPSSFKTVKSNQLFLGWFILYKDYSSGGNYFSHPHSYWRKKIPFSSIFQPWSRINQHQDLDAAWNGQCQWTRRWEWVTVKTLVTKCLLCRPHCWDRCQWPLMNIPLSFLQFPACSFIFHNK